MNNTNTTTFFTLMTALKTATPIVLDGKRGIVRSIAAEDGSLKAWNVALLVNAQLVTVFVRTID